MKKKARKPRLIWWALRRSENALPVVFDTLRAAIENADPDEAVYRVSVVNLHRSRKARGETPEPAG